MPSNWDVALPANTYDALFLEPYKTGTPAQEAAAFLAFVAANKNQSAKVFLYETWPQTSDFAPGYQDFWSGTPSGSNFTQQRASYDALYTTLQATLGSNLWVIPAGSVMNAIDVAARNGDLAGVSTVGDLYRDATHMGDVGQFIAMATVFSTVFRRKAAPTTRTQALHTTGSGTVVLTYALMQQLAGIVWTTVQADSRAFHT